ncbi:hypothetical protein ACTWPT_29620 [Nonomuraea sp. 3N208]|uniref:hypothetical protein n=1 Tax=Nonomuraea sp. 3N208 TaxID=3457421 RepID=UPI003FD0AD74
MVVEELPFVGLGLAPNVDETIREYKINGVGLPYGAEIEELSADGREQVRAPHDGDRRPWVLTTE